MNDLKGTPQQISWATRVRAVKMVEVETTMDYIESEVETIHPSIERAYRYLQDKTASRWWIEHRSMSGAYLLLLCCCAATKKLNPQILELPATRLYFP